MQKIIHTKVNRIIVAGLLGIIVSPALFTLVAHADTEDPSVTYSTMYIPGVTDYNVDGDVTLDVNVAEINALEITLSTSNLAIDLTPKVNTTSFGNDTLDILVGTSNSTGYTLTMQPIYNGSSTTSLTRTEAVNNTNPTIDTITTALSPSTFSSPSDTASTNKWGYMLSTTTLDVDKTIYNPVLTTNTINSSTEAVANHPTSLTFGAKVDNTIPAGNYRATLKFMAVVNPVGYTLTYNANGGSNAPSSVPTVLEATITSSEPTVPDAEVAARYTHDNVQYYNRFLGWNEDENATTATYVAGDTITLDHDTTLYAIYEDGFASGTFQKDDAVCGNNMVDARTGVSYLTYTISGDCYMEQNLYLPTGLTLKPSDSNVTREWTTPTASLTAGNSSTEAMVTGTYTNNTYNATGGWYNYCAASAGTVCNDAKADAAQDVCPKGWKLPTLAQMGNVKNANRSNWKFYAGYYYNGSLQPATTYSAWWSATAYDAIYQRGLRYSNGSLRTDYFEGKVGGFFVRCVRK